MLEKVIIHQLEGVMFHADMAAMYRLIGWHKWMRFHQRQALEEMQGYLMTSVEYAKEAETIPRPVVAPKEFFVTASEILSMDSDEQKNNLHKRAMKEWKQREQETIKIYDSAIGLNPDMKVLSKMKDSVCAELKKIK